MSCFKVPSVSKYLDSADRAISKFLNALGGGFAVCTHDMELKTKVHHIGEHLHTCVTDYEPEIYSYEEFKCTKCGIMENRYTGHYRAQERKIGKWRIPESLQF